LKFWNQVAHSKHFWNLANKKDVLCVKWLHKYYIKGRNLLLMEAPPQASWLVKKVFAASKIFSNSYGNVFQQKHFSLKRMYNDLRGDFSKVIEGKWHVITLLLQNVCLLLGRLYMVDYQLVIGWVNLWYNVPNCALCAKNRMKLTLIFSSLVSFLRLFGKVQCNGVTWTMMLVIGRM